MTNFWYYLIVIIMKREDIRTLSLFIIAILIIILLFLYNDFVNRHQKVDRKIDYIFGNFKLFFAYAVFL